MAEATNITVVAVVSKNLDTTTYRGSAPAWQLARISQVDVFDQVTNPTGLQRDLNKRHASDAYEYAARDADPDRPRAFPEVFLNVRDRKVINVVKEDVAVNGDKLQFAAITFDLDKIDRAHTVKVSRLDGNHRLFYAAGDNKERAALDVMVPFSLTIGLPVDHEGSLFLDINSEQKGLNTSHLNVLRSSLTPEDLELELHPDRAFAMRLTNDEASPWHDLVHMGGSKKGTKEAGAYRPVNFIALENGVRRTLRKSQYLPDLTTADARYGMIRNYWQAVRAVFPEAWAAPREFLVLKNLGVSVFSELGATIIDRCMAAGDVDPGYMVPMLEAAKTVVDWHKDSPTVAGMSGNRAVLLLAGKLAEAMPKKPDTFTDPTTAYEANLAAFEASRAPEVDDSEDTETATAAA